MWQTKHASAVPKNLGVPSTRFGDQNFYVKADVDPKVFLIWLLRNRFFETSERSYLQIFDTTYQNIDFHENFKTLQPMSYCIHNMNIITGWITSWKFAPLQCVTFIAWRLLCACLLVRISTDSRDWYGNFTWPKFLLHTFSM